MKESRPRWLASQWTWTAVLSDFSSETSSIYDFRRVPKVTKQWQYWKVSGHMASICRRGAIQDPHGCLCGANNCCSPWLLWPICGLQEVIGNLFITLLQYTLHLVTCKATAATVQPARICSPYPTLTWFNTVKMQSHNTKVHGAQRFNTLVFSLPGFRGIKKMMANSPKVLPRFIMSTTVFLPQEWKQTGQKWRKVWKAWFVVYTSFFISFGRESDIGRWMELAVMRCKIFFANTCKHSD